MDKGKIKSFAVWVRKAMIGAVRDRGFKVGIEENKIHEIERLQGGFKVVGRDEIFNIAPSHRDKLVELVNEKGYEQVIEEVSYTWFNRFMGLRYMEVNDYLPTGVRILSSEEEGKKEPDVLSKLNEIADDLNLDMNYGYELHDKNTEQAREELYKYILVRQCNELGNIIPQMFEKIQDYTELLLPDNLLQEGSVIRKMVEDIEEEDWKEEVEIIGWMYQYYISEKKDEVFADLKKNVKITKENIPAATQLFTPKWIVKYMVENSLGRLWLEGHPNEELQKEWKYYLEETEQELDVEKELKKIREEHSKLTPEDIKVLDPCMGSGHILVYAFDLLYEIYKSAGYSEREIPILILQNNLYGLDIDDRAAQLASFALIMKARHYNRRLFRENLELNLCSIQESNSIHKEAIDYFCSLETELNNDDLKNDLEYLWSTFTDAKEYGSILEVEEVNFEALKQRLKEIEQDETLMFGDYRKMLLDKLHIIIKQAEIMSRRYEVCVTNPPYASRQNMNEKLIKMADNKFSNSKKDLFSMFIERCLVFTKKKTYCAMITMQSWMFLSSYTELRKYIIENVSITNMLQIGYNSFPGMNSQIAHAVAFVLSNNHTRDYLSKFFDLNSAAITADKKLILKQRMINEEYFIRRVEDFRSIPNYNYAYWVTNNYLNIFKFNGNIDFYATPKQGLASGNNDEFIRSWYEVNYSEIGFFCENIEDFHQKEYLYVPYNKGGDYRKWYGNRENLLRFSKENYKKLSEQGNRLPSREYYFKQGITWSKISTNSFSARFAPVGCVFDSGGATAFPSDNQLKYMLGFMCSKVTYEILKIIAPTINFQVGDVKAIPFIYVDDLNENVSSIVKKCISISKGDYDNFETSWDFKVNPLIKLMYNKSQHKLSTLFSEWESQCNEEFIQLKINEEVINKIFIDIYGLQDELSPEVYEKDITIRKADRERDIKSFISYAVGCIFGRYSIDAEGLIYAGGEFSDKWQFESDNTLVRDIQKDEDGNVISDTWVESRFDPDLDNIIPITEDKYFEDDIVSKFIDFVRTVYGDEYLDDNLNFIADSIGKKSTEISIQAIRRYFIKDFYKDHLKVYQKRPIYWMFDSGKNDGFKALIYMHRYDKSTVAKLRTDYLHLLQRKYEAEIVRQQQLSESNALSAREKTAAKKKIDRINKQLEEIKLYDQVVAHVANERKSIDLDNGVKHNYDLFQGVKVPTDSDKEVKMDLLAKI